MDGDKTATPADNRQLRRWRFGSVEFDERSWTLLVEGRRVPIESKPLELLRELLIRDGAIATRDELLDAIWPNVSVVEASLTTAILKLRRAVGDEKGKGRVIETVPRIGYRIAVPTELADPTEPREPIAPFAREAVAKSPPANGRGVWRWRPVVISLGLVVLAGTVAAPRLYPAAPHAAPSHYTSQDEIDALRELDIDKIKRLLRAGWNPNAPFDNEGNGALNTLMEVCEWDRAHDREKLVLAARTLLEAGARIDIHNIWGDTPYSIAKAKRYCGPEHPVTAMLRESCYTGYKPLGARCEALRDGGIDTPRLDPVAPTKS